MAIFVAEGYDFNLIIEARKRTKAPPARGKKISGFWRFMCIRREQLDQAGDDIIHDDLALKDKVAQEWDNLGRKKQQEFKVLAKCVHFITVIHVHSYLHVYFQFQGSVPKSQKKNSRR